MDQVHRMLPDLSRNGLEQLRREATRRCSPSQAAEAAALLLGSFRRNDAADPERYALGVAAVLSDYPPNVVRAVIDPRIGLPSREEFPPSAAKVKLACENRMQRIRDDLAREERRAATNRLLGPPEEDRNSRPTLDELKARLGDTWGINPVDDAQDRRKHKPLSPAECRAKYAPHMTQAEWDAIPNARMP